MPITHGPGPSVRTSSASTMDSPATNSNICRVPKRNRCGSRIARVPRSDLADAGRSTLLFGFILQYYRSANGNRQANIPSGLDRRCTVA